MKTLSHNRKTLPRNRQITPTEPKRPPHATRKSHTQHQKRANSGTGIRGQGIIRHIAYYKHCKTPK